jgi:S1/P1 Nuclease
MNKAKSGSSALCCVLSDVRRNLTTTGASYRSRQRRPSFCKRSLGDVLKSVAVVNHQSTKYLNLVLALFVWTTVLPIFDAFAWNIPGHMLSGAIASQILQRESPTTITSVRSVLEKSPWYETHWKTQLEKLPETQRDEILFMLAARWADDIRTRDKAESHPPWHYIDFPFKTRR